MLFSINSEDAIQISKHELKEIFDNTLQNFESFHSIKLCIETEDDWIIRQLTNATVPVDIHHPKIQNIIKKVKENGINQNQK